MMLYGSVRLCVSLAGVLLGFTTAFVPPCGAQVMRTAYLRMDAESPEEFNTGIKLAEERGAVLRHRIYPYAAIGKIPEGSESLLEGLPGINDVFAGQLLDKHMVGMTLHEIYAARAYNGIYFPRDVAAMEPQAQDAAAQETCPLGPTAGGLALGRHTRGEPGPGEPAYLGPAPGGPFSAGASLPVPGPVVPIDPEPLTIPKEKLDEIKAARAARGAPIPSPPPTSEFMLGHVAMAVIMPESEPGHGRHDWLEEEEEIATEEIIGAMDWWARHSPEHNIKITYEINYRVPVNLEPLDRGGWAIEDKWAGQTLANLGYAGVNHYDQSYLYIDDMRRKHGADWGFISFILHGFKGQNFGGFLAYAYLGGPLNANLYSNGYLGPEKLDRVMAHEIGHNFYTIDEYEASPHDCAARSGYLNAENANKIYGGAACKLNQACIMRGAGQEVELAQLHPCYYTEGQVGWWDSDGDGIPDVLDTDPIVESLAVEAGEETEPSPVDTVYTSDPSFKGVAVAVPLPNMNPLSEVTVRDVTIEPVAAEYRVDGGPWIACEAVDGEFDGPKEEFRFSLSGLSPWATHTVEARAVTAHGNITPDSLITYMQFFVAPDPGDKALVRMVSSSPARPPVLIRFVPAHPSGQNGLVVPVEVAIYDALGRKIRTVEDGDLETGRYYEAVWDGTDASGNMVPAGVYMIGMNCQGRLAADKVLVVR
jgi:hypothetical protein